jgi:UDP-GlcNAc:undecaprenyl-phosphate GlcNAc-1-phosphate transferase
MKFVPFLCIFLISLATVLATTPLARRIAVKLDAVDYPTERRINKKPTPRMGGIAIFLALAAALVLQVVGATFWNWPPVLVSTGRVSVNYPVLGLAFVAIFATGAIDDVKSLKPLPKLIGQIVAASLAVASGLVIGDIVNPFIPGGEVNLGWLAYPVTVVYLVAFVNIINLIDGLDGLASGVTCIASFTMFILAMNAGRLDAAALAIAICGATLGFLKYNFHPASIFLGDSGSLLLGFSLGVMSLLTVTRFAGLTTMIIPLVLAGIPIIDTFSAIIRRSRAHVSVGHADKGHIHHRLLAAGYDQRQAALIVYAWTAILCVGAYVMTQVGLWPRIGIFVALLVGSVLYARHLHLFRPVLLHHEDEQGRDRLIGPDDPDFKEEARKQDCDGDLPHRNHEER